MSLIKYDPIKLITLFDYNQKKKLVLPSFQRDFVWDTKAQQKLAASLVARLPIGNVLLLEGDRKNFPSRSLGMTGIISEQEIKEECFYLLDGQQRISTLLSIFSDILGASFPERFDSVFQKLRNRWFIKVQPDEGVDDIFGYENLFFSEDNFLNCEPSELEPFFVCKKINSQTKRTEWFHPSKFSEARSTNEQATTFCSNAAKEFLVPMFQLFSSRTNNHPTPLHTQSLQLIAEKRKVELKARSQDSPSIENEILGKNQIDQNILKILKKPFQKRTTKEHEDIDAAWQTVSTRWHLSVSNFLVTILHQEIPQILLPEREITRGIAIFETINKPGTPLTIYDLLAAKAASQSARKKHEERGLFSCLNEHNSLTETFVSKLKSSILLPDSLIVHVKNIDAPYQWNPENMDVLDKDDTPNKLLKNQFLNLLSIFTHFAYGSFEEVTSASKQIKKFCTDLIKRKGTFSIEGFEIHQHAEDSINALIRACAFLQVRCGVVKANLSYELMILPIAYVLRSDDVWNNSSKLDKVEFWYWSSIFGGSYQNNQNHRCIEDLRNLYLWVNEESKENPFQSRASEVLQVKGYSSKDVLLMKDPENKPPQSIHNTILQYVLTGQPKDFLSADLRLNAWSAALGKEFVFEGKTYELKLEDHHICPLGDCAKLGESTQKLRADKSHILNSPLNRTYISSVANNLIRDRSPTRYFEEIKQIAPMGHIVPTPIESHFKKRHGESYENYYERILEERYNKLLERLALELDELAG